jgi:hypothetical protein
MHVGGCVVTDRTLKQYKLVDIAHIDNETRCIVNDPPSLHEG